MKKTVLALALLSSISAYAGDFYVVGGFGKSILKESPTDNDWHQNGFGDVKETKSNTWKLGAGYKINRYIDAELDYRDLGQFDQTSMYVSDLGGEGSYNSQTKHCNGPCEPTSVSFQHGTTKGLGLSLLIHPDWEITPYARIGAFYHMSEFYSAQKFGSLPNQTQFAVFHENAEANDYKTPFKDNGVNLMYGFGIRAGFLEIEYTKYSKVQSWVAPYQNASSITLNARKEF